MNNTNKSLSREEAEAMLPDYVFGQLTEYEKDVFEASLASYPDLKEEMTDMHLVFKNLEKEKYKNMHAQRTRNLSVSVLKRLEQRDIRRKKYVRAATFGIPGMAAAVIAIIMMFPGIAPLKFGESESTFGMQLASLLSPNEVESIIETASSEGISQPAMYIADYTSGALPAELDKIPATEGDAIIAELGKELDASFKTDNDDLNDSDIEQLEKELQELDTEIQEVIQNENV